MPTKKPVALAVILMVVGLTLLLGKLGVHPGHWIALTISWVVPLILIAVGYAVLKRGSLIGWIIGSFGIIALIAKLGSLVMIIIAIALIVYGASLLTPKR